MRVIIFEAPEDLSELPKWLDSQLVGLNLPKLVSELEVMREKQLAQTLTLEDILADRMPAVLDFGTSVLRPDQFRQLMNHPRLLIALQERILERWSTYWSTVAVHPEEDLELSQILINIKRRLSEASAVRTAPKLGSDAIGTSSAKAKSQVLKVWLPLALAAALLLALGSWLTTPKANTGWGFNKTGLLSANISSKEYLSKLADAAGEWTKKRPANAVDLETRLKQFRAGCDVLLNAPHPQLNPEDRRWLVSSCRQWASELDTFISRVRSDSNSRIDVQRQADEMIFQMQQSLRDRALKAG